MLPYQLKTVSLMEFSLNWAMCSTVQQQILKALCYCMTQYWLALASLFYLC